MSNCTAVNLFVEETNLSDSIARHLRYTVGKSPAKATKQDVFYALAHSIREQLIDRMLDTEMRHTAQKSKQLVYLSAEFLIGQSLRNNLFNLGMLEEANRATQELGFGLEEITDAEADAPLGNGGLGRLAACFMESLATLGMPAYGFGINYQFGLFKQEIEDGPDGENGTMVRPQLSLADRASGGGLQHPAVRHESSTRWTAPASTTRCGWTGGWHRRSARHARRRLRRQDRELPATVLRPCVRRNRHGDLQHRRLRARGGSRRSVGNNLQGALPVGRIAAGRELRLVQEYFLVACAVRDIVRRFAEQQPSESFDAIRRTGGDSAERHAPGADGRGADAILVDETRTVVGNGMGRHAARCGYTNHTLMPEALEKWPVQLIEKVLPRHLQIIYEINRRFLADVGEKYPGDKREARAHVADRGRRSRSRCAWPTWPSSAATRSTASRHCTVGW